MEDRAKGWKLLQDANDLKEGQIEKYRKNTSLNEQT
jgi:hypothetical protein